MSKGKWNVLTLAAKDPMTLVLSAADPFHAQVPKSEFMAHCLHDCASAAPIHWTLLRHLCDLSHWIALCASGAAT
jgi:hypothetical protein